MEVVKNNTLEESVNTFLDYASKIISNYEFDNFSVKHWLYLRDKNCLIKSPIEKILYLALNTIQQINEIEIDILPQQKIDTYYVDFLIKKDNKKVLVECDGHKFHDKDKYQRAYEKRRDRFLQKNGYKIFHYTGSEIVKDNYKIACEIISEVTNIEEELLFGTFENYSYKEVLNNA